ncbi:cell wall hydrolase [Phosphitispora sp. TUW77]|uniref:cell wall hydrolase n=1 Tax=Phosphitispora sp. TUW77 TaxID=3152361 RepID=UPI003AB125B3
MKKTVLRKTIIMVVTMLLILVTADFAGASYSYTVQNGDSLYLIAKKYGTTVLTLKSANRLTSNIIYPGQSLVVSGDVSSSYNSRYTVTGGDTLYLISKRFGISVDEIISANSLTTTIIYPGQVLNIPGISSRAAPTVSRSHSRTDLDLLARAVYAEARGETYEGQVAVAAVILNRVKHSGFPNTIPEVIYQPGAFTAVDDGQIYLAADETAYTAVQDAVNGWDPSYGALYYWNPATAQNKWVWSRTIIRQIGNHIFAK